MSLNIGIIGLPNVGKSTVFNALTKEQQAQVANYPFCTIEPNRAVVPVPDARLDKLHKLADVPNIIYTTIQFVDIAGLVKGASQGEGLGNQFLANIRDVDAIIHVVRCFEDDNIVHVSPHLNPSDDIETINLELALADLQQAERKIERLQSQLKGDKKLVPVLEMIEAMRNFLDQGGQLSNFPQQDSDIFHDLEREMRFLTAKPLIYVANVDEAGLAEDNDYIRLVREIAVAQGFGMLKLCAQLEEDMAGFSDEERLEFLEMAGTEEEGLAQVLRKSYALLGLISFFTMNEKEVRAWTVRQGATAPQAAGVIHTDFERGFIRAEVIPFEIFAQHGSSTAAKAVGQMQVEGKGYIVQDGDVIYFRFNV